MTSTAISRLFSIALCCAVFAAPVLAQEAEQYVKPTSQTEAADMMTTLQAEGEFTVFLDALKKSGVDKMLKKQGPITLFAPTDEAFAKLPEGTLEQLSNEELATVLKHHIVLDNLTSDRAISPGKALSTSGESVEIKKTEDGGVMVNNATLVKTNIAASNGVIHSIDTVLGLSSDDTIGSAGDSGGRDKLTLLEKLDRSE